MLNSITGKNLRIIGGAYTITAPLLCQVNCTDYIVPV